MRVISPIRRLSLDRGPIQVGQLMPALLARYGLVSGVRRKPLDPMRPVRLGQKSLASLAAAPEPAAV